MGKPLLKRRCKYAAANKKSLPDSGRLSSMTA
jgi:hypothetical protein